MPRHGGAEQPPPPKSKQQDDDLTLEDFENEDLSDSSFPAIPPGSMGDGVGGLGGLGSREGVRVQYVSSKNFAIKPRKSSIDEGNRDVLAALAASYRVTIDGGAPPQQHQQAERRVQFDASPVGVGVRVAE